MKIYLTSVICVICCYAASYGQKSILHFSPDKFDSKLLTSYGKSKNDQSADTSSVSLINYNEAFRFDGEDDYMEYKDKIKDLSNVTVFTVFRSKNDSVKEAEIWGMYGENSALGLSTKTIVSSKMQSGYEGVSPGSVVLHVFTETNPSNNNSGNTNSILNVGVIKKAPANRYFKGDVAEIIVFDKRLKGVKRQIVESKLALKYGVTLNQGEDYKLSKRRIVWDADENEEFSYNIAGIGRDNGEDVYQNQSTSSNEPGLLVIGVDSIVKSNSENNGKIKNHQFLVWGDNNAPLIESKDNNPEGKVPMLQRKWLMKATGNRSDEINTQVVLDANKLFGVLGAKEDYSLIIDRSGTGNFEHQDCSYISPSDLSSDGILRFNNISWDIDGSGKDVFSFSLRKDLVASLSGEASTICNEEATVLNYDREGGIPPYSYTLSDTSGFSKNWKSDQDKEMDYSIKDIPAGDYTLTITDYTGAISKADFTVMEEPLVTVELGEDKFMEEEVLLIDPQISNKEKVVSFEWTGDNGFSNDRESVKIIEPGSYTLTLTTEAGCTCSDTIFISDKFVQDFSLYPNPAPGGEYNISVSLTESSDINVRVYNLLGVLVYEYKAENQKQVNIEADAIGSSGLYTVVLQTSKGRVSTKLLVK
ncbi:T9SS type A sorting domain-containing protein [Salinimicrobium gaetbulicola]|uniref:T9SS type A sorting domain-containing protein n=1 Tax=Salinimicrobium gaetbulicola TaxID=999702 RepID=A0ABW3IB87_9FLAO